MNNWERRNEKEPDHPGLYYSKIRGILDYRLYKGAGLWVDHLGRPYPSDVDIWYDADDCKQTG